MLCKVCGVRRAVAVGTHVGEDLRGGVKTDFVVGVVYDGLSAQHVVCGVST
jgi:hypothetical protein